VTSWSIPGGFRRLTGMAVDPAGHIFVVDGGARRVSETSASGVMIVHWGVGRTKSIALTLPRGVTVDAQGNVYVADAGGNHVSKLTPNGDLISRWTSALGVSFQFPQAVAADTAGDLYVADSNHSRIVKLTPQGGTIPPWGTGDSGDFKLYLPSALALAPDGNLWVASGGSGTQFHEFSPAGKLLKDVLSFPSASWGVPGGVRFRVQRRHSHHCCLVPWGLRLFPLAALRVGSEYSAEIVRDVRNRPGPIQVTIGHSGGPAGQCLHMR
jgi:sugar lactone lactonase YvrE